MGWDANDMLDGLAGIMNLAAASGESLGTTSDIVTDALTAFGLSAKDSTHFADLLATASANANTNVSMMGQTFKYVAPVAGSLGYSAEDVAEAVGLMANAGIKASSAGTSLRSIMTRLGTDAGASSTKLGALGILTEKLGVQFYDSQGNARAFGDVIRETREVWKGLDDETAIFYANQIAGKNALSGWMALMEASEEDIEKLSGAIANCDGAAQGMAATMNDNLSGALTIFNSALEGFGIAVYNKISDPLTKVVELGTGVVSAVTGWLDPAKSEIEEYLGEIGAANEQIKKNLDTIHETLDNDLAEVGQLESYKDFFEDVVESGEKLQNLSINDFVVAAVGDFETLKRDGTIPISEEFLNIVTKIGSVKEADILGGTLESSTEEITTDITGVGDAAEDSKKDFDEFGDLVVQVYDDVGDATETASTDVSAFGDGTVQVFEKIDSTAEGSQQKIREFFAPVKNEETFWVTMDNLTKEMGVLTDKEKEAAEKKGDLLGKTYFQVDHSFEETLIAWHDGLENVVFVADDFERRKITAVIEHIAKLKPEARDLWNEQYGVLNKNVEIFDELINLEEAYLLNQAVNKAKTQFYDELSDALLQLYRSESGAKNLLKEINEELEKAGHKGYETLDEFAEAGDIANTAVQRLADGFGGFVDEANADGVLARVWTQYNEDTKLAIKNTDDATASVEAARAGIDGCADILEDMTETTGFTVEEVNALDESMSITGETAQGTATDISQFKEEEDEAAESADELAESVDELNKKLQKATEEGLKDQKKALEELQKEYQKLREEAEKTISDIVHGGLWNYGEIGEGEEPPNLLAMRDVLAHNMEEMDQWKADMETLSGQIGSTISLGFFEAILDKGPEYGAEVRAMVNDLFTTGGTNLHALSTTYDDVTNRETNMSKYFGALKFTMDNSLAEVAEGLDYDGFWNIVREYLYNAEYENPIDNQMVVKLGELSELANRIGAGLPEELAEGIIEGSISPGEAVNSVNEIILARLGGLVDQANEMGAHIPPSLLEGVEAGRISVEGAFNEVLDSIADITGIEVQGHAAGNHFLQSFTEGMDPDNANTIEYYNEAGEVYDKFTEGIKDNIDATGVGEKVMEDTASGIKSKEGDVTSEAESVVSEAETKATTKAQDFTTTGETAVQSMTDGAKSKQKTFTDQMNDIVKAGLDKVDEYDDDFQKAGKDIPDQIAKGVKGNTVSDAVDEAVRAAVEAAGSHSDAFEAKGGSFISAMINGVANPNYQQQLAQSLANAVIYAQNSVDTSGFFDIGRRIDEGVAYGIGLYQSTVTNAAINMANATYAAATNALQIQSPSKLFETGVGQMIAKGMAKGIEDGELYLIDAIDQVVQTATSEAEDLVLMLNDELDPLVLKVDMDTSSLDQLAPPEVEGSAALAGLADRAESSASALASYAESTDFGSLIAENTKSLERLIDCATLMLNAAKTMGEKVGVTIINEIDGTQFDSRIRTVSQKSINQRSRQLAYAGGR